MKLPSKEIEGQIGRWKVGLVLSPGTWMIGVWWDGNPISFSLTLPFLSVWIEHDGGRYWPWEWTIVRVVVGKQEFRVDLALNSWGLGIKMHHTDDWSIHIGPLDIECEYDKFCDDDIYTTPPVLLRLFSKAREPCECELEDRPSKPSLPPR